MELKTGYKQTEAGVIPEDWNAKTIDEVSFVTSGKRLPLGSTLTNRETLHPYIRVTDMRPGTVSPADIKFVPAEVYPFIKRYRIFRGDIFISVAGTLGIVGKVPKDLDGANLTENADRITSISCSQDYLLHVLMSPLVQDTIEALQTVGAQPKLALTRIRKFVVPLPPTKAEQEAIAEVLGDAVALTESLEQLVAKKRHIKQGAMQELLLPKDGWVQKKLSELASIQRGASPRPIDSPIWFDDNSAVGWVRISDVTRADMFLRETTQRLSPLGIQNSRPVIRGSLIMSICATVGRPIITEIDTCIHDGFVVFDGLRANQLFLYYMLKSIEGDWAKHGQTGSQMNLNTGLINRTVVATPKTQDEQTAIAAVLSDMDAEIAALEAKLAKTRQIKQGIMHNLLTGRIRLV